MKKSMSIGPVNLTIEGDNALAEHLSEHLVHSGQAESPEVDLVIKVLSRDGNFNFKPEYYSGHLSFNGSEFLFKDRGFEYLAKDVFSDSTPAMLLIRPHFNSSSSSVMDILGKARAFLFSREFLNRKERVYNTILSYSCFWYLFHLILLKKRYSFIHAGIVSKGEKAALITGTGGCGKTSVAFKLLEDDFEYLSEDFGILGSDGQTFLSGRELAIYASDAAYGQRDLVRFEKNILSGLNKLQWNTQKCIGGNPLRRVSPFKIFDPAKIGRHAQVSHAFYLIRQDSERIEVKDISAEEMAERCIKAMFRELKQTAEIINSINSVGADSVEFPALEQIIQQSKDILHAAFKNIQRKILVIPRQSDIAPVTDIIKKEIIK